MTPENKLSKKQKVFRILMYCFFRVEWRDESDEEKIRKGYFMVKRRWVWWLLFPIMFIGVSLHAGYELIVEIYNFRYHWITTSNPEQKLSVKQKMSLLAELWD